MIKELSIVIPTLNEAEYLPKLLALNEVLDIDEKTLRYQDIKRLEENYIKNTTYPMELLRHFVQVP